MVCLENPYAFSSQNTTPYNGKYHKPTRKVQFRAQSTPLLDVWLENPLKCVLNTYENVKACGRNISLTIERYMPFEKA
jgi:hypothetical protein